MQVLSCRGECSVDRIVQRAKVVLASAWDGKSTTVWLICISLMKTAGHPHHEIEGLVTNVAVAIIKVRRESKIFPERSVFTNTPIP